jgi:DNA replication and repair protein RecF
VLVTAIEATALRSLAAVRVELGEGIVTLIGPNGAGKTNLLEALYFALTGRSFRTSDRRELIPFGGQFGRAEATLRDRDGVEHRLLASVSRSEGRRHLLDGSPAEPAEIRRHRPPVAVFSPDRLTLVKGPPAERRAHIDSYVAARWPARAQLRQRYGQALAQRNALLARLAAGRGGGDLAVWDQALAESAASLVAARREAADDLSAPFAAAADALGLGAGSLEYAPRADGSPTEIRAGLEQRREADLRLGRSSWGPHLDDLRVLVADRSLRRFGSQGQQRAGLLALLFAEREELLAANRVVPLLLLDDVMSELDPERRDGLVACLAGDGQALITAAAEESVPPSARRRVVRMPFEAPRSAAA